MSLALNCNRCGAFVSLAPPKEKPPITNVAVDPAIGWRRLSLTTSDPWGVGANDLMGGSIDARKHLCPSCIVALDQFLDNKPVEPALVHLDCKVNIELFNTVFVEDHGGFSVSYTAEIEKGVKDAFKRTGRR